nr:MAG TPA: hypothetical protein [Caudoviricetes sp.]
MKNKFFKLLEPNLGNQQHARDNESVQRLGETLKLRLS